MVVLKHHGVKGMRWGVRKKRDSNSSKKTIDYKTESFRIKKGTEIHRISNVSKETNKGSGYASFLKEDVKTYQDTGKLFSKFGTKQFDLTFKAKKDLISPSQKVRVDTFLKKLNEPDFARELRNTQRRMFILNIPTPGDVKMSLKYENLSLNKARGYRMLNLAISGNKSLRSKYLNEFKKAGYNILLDEADSTNKVSKAPIIFIERSDTLEFLKSDSL